jgi:hypothetical protein
MLERVSAALTKFLAPLTSSINNGLGSNLTGKEDFQRFKKKPKHEEAKTQEKVQPEPHKSVPHLKLVPSSATETIATKDPIPGAGLTSAITDIFALFQDQRTLMRRWGGAKTYAGSMRSKSMSQLRKGTILDEKAD